MTPEELLDQVKVEFGHRKFAAGLALAFIDFLVDIGAIGRGLTSYEDLVGQYPRVLRIRNGRQANTLIVRLPRGKTRSIRRYYDPVEREIRSRHMRLDFPSAAPHATQGWVDYTPWLGAMVTFDREALSRLRTQILDFILERLPSHAVDPALIVPEPPIFRQFLLGFDLAPRRGEPTGSAFQGAVFGYLRADAPHLQVEVRKVRAGSKRTGAIGDIDAWDGDRLILSAEAKHYVFPADAVPDAADFAARVASHRALGLFVAEDFGPGAREGLIHLGLRPISRVDLADLAGLWDPLKQRIAAQALLYFASHVEQNSALTARIRAFIAAPHLAPPPTAE